MAFSLLADLEVSSILDLTPEWFQNNGIRLMLLDFDNTVVAYTVSDPSPEFLRWLEKLRETGVDVMIVSNSRKSRRVPDFCEKWGNPYVKRAGKPSTRGIRSAMAQFDAGPEETALAGDQIFTDILGGNRAGITSILVRPILFSNPFQVVRFGIEQPFIRLARRKRSRNMERSTCNYDDHTVK